MTQIALLPTPQEHAFIRKQSGAFQIGCAGPSRRAVSGDMALVATAQDRTNDRRQKAERRTGDRDQPATCEHFRRIGFIGVPPLEQPPRFIDWCFACDEPGRAKRCLMAKRVSGHLCGEPDRSDDQREHHHDLANEYLCAGHGVPP